MIKSSIFTLDNFSGGLNTKTGTMQIGLNESPNCLNCHSNLFKSLQWRNGSAYLNPLALTDSTGRGAIVYPHWSGGVLTEELIGYWNDKMYRMMNLDGSFTGIPFATAQADDTFDSTIYSTSTQNYLISGNYQLTPLQVYDGISNADLDQSVLTGARHVVAWRSHLWSTYTKEGGVEYPYRLRRTDIRTYGSAAADWTGGVAGYDDVVTNDGDYTTGFAILRGFMYLFKRRSIFRVSYLGGSPLVEIRQVASIGTESNKTISNITLLSGDEILTFLGSDNRIYVFNGYNAPQPISELIGEDNGISNYSLPKVNKDQHRYAVGIDYDRRHWYVLFTTFGNAMTTNNGGYIIDYYTTPFSIFPFDGWNASGALMVKDSTGTRNLYFQGYDGRMRQADTGTSDCGTAINSYFETSKMKVDKEPILKKTQQAQPLFKSIGDYDVTFGYRTNFNAGYVDTDINLAGSGFTLGSSTLGVLGSSTLGGTEGKIGVVDIPKLFNFLQFRLKSLSDEPRMNMYTIDLLATGEGIAKV